MRPVLSIVALLSANAAITAALEIPEDHIVVDGLEYYGHGRRLTRGGADCHKGCPVNDDENFDVKCLEAAMPPFPMCTKLTPAEWVKKAVDGSSRCCGDDLSECKCPVKDSERFLNKIQAHCDGIEICKSQLLALETAGNEFVSVERLEAAEIDPNN